MRHLQLGAFAATMVFPPVVHLVKPHRGYAGNAGQRSNRASAPCVATVVGAA